MEDDKLVYRYSLRTSLLYSIVCAGSAAWLTIATLGDLFDHSILEAFVFGMAPGFLIICAIRIIFRYLIPALRKRIALEINRQGIIYYPKRAIIEWEDIASMRLNVNADIAVLYFYFLSEDGEQDSFRAPLTWVKCKPKEVYGIIEANLDERNPNRRNATR